MHFHDMGMLMGFESSRRVPWKMSISTWPISPAIWKFPEIFVFRKISSSMVLYLVMPHVSPIPRTPTLISLARLVPPRCAATMRGQGLRATRSVSGAGNTVEPRVTICSVLAAQAAAHTRPRRASARTRLRARRASCTARRPTACPPTPRRACRAAPA